MLKNTRHIFCIAAVVLLGMMGCTKEDATTGGETLPTGEAVSVTLALCVDDLQTPGVKSKSADMGTSRVIHSERSEAMLLELIEEPAQAQNQPQTRAMNDSQIANIWVFQYDGTEPTSKLIRKDYYASYTEGMKFELYARASQRVAVIANTFSATFGNDQTLNTSTYQTLLNKTTSVTTQDNVITNSGNNIPFSGTSTEAVKEASIINMNLMRNVAQVTFKVKTGNITAPSWTIQMRDVPNVSYWMAQRDDTPFPASVTPVSYPMQEVAGMSSDNFSEFSWYVPTNLRGTVDGTTAKTRTTNAPTGATYVRILGETTTFKGVSYNIHLGADFATDYNVNPNYKYSYQITLYTDPYVTDSNVALETFALDYTDSEIPLFAGAKEDVKNPSNGSTTMNWFLASGTYNANSNPTTLKACPDGWRLPTQNELMLMWVYKKELNIPEQGYWSTTTDVNTLTNANIVFFTTGNTHGLSSKTGSAYARCIRDISDQPVKYPNVATDGKTIISREGPNGVKTNMLLTDDQKNWLMTTNTEVVTYNQSSEYNRVSAKFEVATTDCTAQNVTVPGYTGDKYTLKDAFIACKDYSQDGVPKGSWRIPTQRELMLIWIFKSSLSSINPLAPNNFRSSTVSSGSVNYGWCVYFGNGSTGSSITISERLSLRCIRDL